MMAKIALPPEVLQKFKEAGSRGGRATVQRHGKALFKRIGKEGGKISKRGPSKKKTRGTDGATETPSAD